MRNNLDELINILTEVEERSMMQILFRSKHQESHNPESAPKFPADPLSTVFSSAVPCAIHVLVKAKSVVPKTCSPSSSSA